MYTATTCGNIVGKRGALLTLILKPNGYLYFSQSNGAGQPNQTSVHRFIWCYFNGPIVGDCVVDHINGDRCDNRLCNLRLLTNQENVQSSIHLTASAVRRIRELIGTTTNREIARQFSISEQSVCDIKHHRRWGNIKELH